MPVDLVLILRDWTAFKEYMERWEYMAEVVYRVDPSSDGGMRVRAIAGRYGVDMTMRKDDPTYGEVLDVLSKAKRIQGAKDPSVFLS